MTPAELVELVLATACSARDCDLEADHDGPHLPWWRDAEIRFENVDGVLSLIDDTQLPCELAPDDWEPPPKTAEKLRAQMREGLESIRESMRHGVWCPWSSGRRSEPCLCGRAKRET